MGFYADFLMIFKRLAHMLVEIRLETVSKSVT